MQYHCFRNPKIAFRLVPFQVIRILVMMLSGILVLISGCSLFQNRVLFQYPETGFAIRLPESWRGYQIESAYWEGIKNEPDTGDVVVASGPMITILHPDSKPENPRQGIPIMVLTIPQWDAMQDREWHIGAAPVLPMEIGRNSQYVFALPARYNYAFLEGWEEVEEIILGQSIIISEPELPQDQE